MRWIRALAASAALMMLAVSLGCGGDKDSTATAPDSAAAPRSGDKAQANARQAVAASAAKAGPAVPLDTSYILPEHFVAAVVQPRRIAELPLVAAQLKDEKIAAAIQDFGVEPSEVEQLVIAVSMVAMDPKYPAEPMPTVIAHFNHDVDGLDMATKLQKVMDSRNPKGFKETEVEGKKCFILGPGDAIVYAPEARTVILTNPIVLKKIIAGGAGKSPVAEKLAKIDADNEAVLVAMPGESPAFLEGYEHQVGDDPMAKSFAAVLKGVDYAEALVNLKGESLLSLTVDAKDGPAADSVKDLLKDLVKMAGAGVAFVKQNAPPDVKTALGPALKLAGETLDDTKVTAQGNRVTAVIKRPAELDEVAGPQLEQMKKIMREKAEAVQRLNRLKMIGLAFHEYAATNANFPPAYITKGYKPTLPSNNFPGPKPAAEAPSAKDGKPLLSWRVAILPMIGEEALYKQFHLDEPWDGPHNSKLLDKMPDIYRTPGRSTDGKTSIMVFAGKNTVFDGDHAMPFSEIRDGLSNTILAVEAGPDKAVPWTKPEDLPFDPKDPAAALGQAPAGGFAALFCDGAVYVIPGTISKEDLKALITPSGNEPVDREKALGAK